MKEIILMFLPLISSASNEEHLDALLQIAQILENKYMMDPMLRFEMQSFYQAIAKQRIILGIL